MSPEPTTLNPSWLHLDCKEVCEPISDLHASKLSEVGRRFSSAISEYRELACYENVFHLVVDPHNKADLEERSVPVGR